MKSFFRNIYEFFTGDIAVNKTTNQQQKQKVEFNPPIIKATVNNSKYMNKTKFNHKRT